MRRPYASDGAMRTDDDDDDDLPQHRSSAHEHS